MYHYVDVTPPAAGPYSAGLTVPTRQFQAEMNYLAANGYHPVTLEQVYAAMAGGSPLPTKPVALTFDDGGLDNFTVAFPILQEHHFRATFFVITGFVGKPVCMSWDQLREMYAAGMAIESHTVHHPDLRTLDPAGLAQELSQSRATLMDELGETPIALAYPSGAYDQAVVAATAAAGYLVAVTTHPGRVVSPLAAYTWPRLRVSPDESLNLFAKELAG
jgi:peptidoglycan/xylan/chitin deacetylase (PgdA/CDA1 family)